MKQVNEMPIDGQFVVVWENDNGLWSATFMFEEGVLFEYTSSEGDWESCSTHYFKENSNRPTAYYVKGSE